MFKLNFYYIWFFFMIFISMLFLLIGLTFVIKNYSMLIELPLFTMNSFNVMYIVYLDWVSLIFMFVVFFISSMVILYSMNYMGNYNYSSIRFLMILLLFVFSMLLMVISPNLVSIMLGWDGLGLVSYCLVIYYSSLKSYLAGMITCLVNRLGDLGLLISVSWLFSYGSWNLMYYLGFYYEYIFYMIILSSFTKSAQIPFSMWLPAAMAAPTPVSSLVHSSTLVTAGIYLLIRFFNYTNFMNNFFLCLSILTMMMASVCAAWEFDLKKIIALSTLSQLGLMMSCLFMGLWELSLFHLLSHAMFKSLLFLCAGIMIHLMGGCQDIRLMGSISCLMPLTCCCFNISNMSLCGFPFLSGFYSKDMIIELMMMSGLNFLLMLILYLSLGLTSFYSVRLFYYTVLSQFKYYNFLNLTENILLMKYSIMFLCFFSVSFGSMFIWIMNLDLYFLLVPLQLKLVTMVMVFLGVFIGYEFSKLILLKNYISYMNGSMWFMFSYSYYLFNSVYNYSLSVNSMLYWGEYYGGMGISFYTVKLSNYLQLYSMSSLKVFFLVILVWMMLLF